MHWEKIIIKAKYNYLFLIDKVVFHQWNNFKFMFKCEKLRVSWCYQVLQCIDMSIHNEVLLEKNCSLVKYNAREDENFWLFISGAKNPNTITLVCLLQKCIDLGGQGILNSWISYQYQSHEIRKYSLCK